MDKNTRITDDIGLLVYDPHPIDLGRLTLIVARAYPGGTIVEYHEKDYEPTKLFFYRGDTKHELYRRLTPEEKGGKA